MKEDGKRERNTHLKLGVVEVLGGDIVAGQSQAGRRSALLDVVGAEDGEVGAPDRLVALGQLLLEGLCRRAKTSGENATVEGDIAGLEAVGEDLAARGEDSKGSSHKGEVDNREHHDD